MAERAPEVLEAVPIAPGEGPATGANGEPLPFAWGFSQEDFERAQAFYEQQPHGQAEQQAASGRMPPKTQPAEGDAQPSVNLQAAAALEHHEQQTVSGMHLFGNHENSRPGNSHQGKVGQVQSRLIGG